MPGRATGCQRRKSCRLHAPPADLSCPQGWNRHRVPNAMTRFLLAALPPRERVRAAPVRSACNAGSEGLWPECEPLQIKSTPLVWDSPESVRGERIPFGDFARSTCEDVSWVLVGLQVRVTSGAAMPYVFLSEVHYATHTFSGLRPYILANAVGTQVVEGARGPSERSPVPVPGSVVLFRAARGPRDQFRGPSSGSGSPESLCPGTSSSTVHT